jgi:spermidine synthase
MSPGLRLKLVLSCFFLSGLTALIYQTAWTREFAFVFGTSELAVATVLAAYMGGLAAGSAAAARFASRVRRPILVYGLLELGVATSALLVPFAIRAATGLYALVFSGRVDAGGIGSALFYVAASFAVLVVPTAFMGATLPLLARHAVRSDSELGPRIGLLYSINTVGAVVGTLVAAYVLLPVLGLGGTVGVAVGANALVFVVAAAVARGAPDSPSAAAAVTSQRAAADSWILPLILLSGIASFTYEVLWTRLLGHVLGGSVYAFATMLASFLIGIAGGAALASRRATTPRVAALGFAVAQLGTAAFALAAFAGADALPDLARALRETQAWGDALVSGLFLLPATLCIGATFPFAVRVLARGGDDAGPASARVYAWNTVGAIVGALGAGFFVVPALGFAGSFRAAALLNLGLGGAAAWLAAPPARRITLVAGAAALVLLFLAPGTPWNVLRTGPFGLRPGGGEVSFFAVGRSATVLVLEKDGQWNLRTNGLPEASIRPPGHPPSRYRTSHWLSALPLIARPDARSMLVIGLGGGLAIEAIPESVQSIDVVELEPEVVEANRSLASVRARDPLADPRVNIIVNDARGALVLSETRYDAIVSQPSHPWTAGASHLYTREFFALARDRLTADGVVLQWIGPGFVDEPLLRILVATLADVFPHVTVHQPEQGGGILLLASAAPLDPVGSAPRALAAAPEVFGPLGLSRAEDVAASLLLDAEGARRFANGAPLNRDRRNHLQMRSPRLRRAGIPPLSPEPLVVKEGLAPEPGADLDGPLLVGRLLDMGFLARARAVAPALADPADRDLAAALLQERAGKRAQALSGVRSALERDPGHARARAAMFRMLGPSAFSSDVMAAAEAGPAEQAVREALGLLETDGFDPAAWAPVDARLARVLPGEAFFAPAVRLRVRWRHLAGSAAMLREAVALVDVLVGRSVPGGDLFERARIGAALGDTVLTLSSIDTWLLRLGPKARAGAALREAQGLVAGLPDAERWQAWRASTGARLTSALARSTRR